MHKRLDHSHNPDDLFINVNKYRIVCASRLHEFCKGKENLRGKKLNNFLCAKFSCETHKYVYENQSKIDLFILFYFFYVITQSLNF